jgi:hypothetical protein
MPNRRPVEITTTPDTPPLLMKCPICAQVLMYEHTVMGGVVPRERWDLFRCSLHGQFEYRYRTRRLRSVPSWPSARRRDPRA